MFGGYALFNIISYIQSFFGRESIKKSIAVFCPLALIIVFWYNNPYIKKTYRDRHYFTEYKGGLLALTDYIKTHTSPNDLIMIFDNDWNSEIPYNARRKALMVCWMNENSYFKNANDYELFIMNKNYQFNGERLSKLPADFEACIGDYNVYRRKK
jgi:hypothetical protein